MPMLHEITSDQPVMPAAGRFDAVEQIAQDGAGQVFPAAVVVVVRDGEVLLHRAWGCIDPEAGTPPARTASLFDMASITKLFTVTALLRLLHWHQIALETPLVELVPAFGAGGPRPLDGGQDPHTRAPLPVPDDLRGVRVDPRQVTLWHLLTHTSGLAPWRAVYEAAGPVPAPPDEPEPVPPQERWRNGLAFICDAPFVGVPGDAVRYSDLGLMLLGEVVRRLAGTGLDEAISAAVCGPLGLETVRFNPVQGGIPRASIAPTEDDTAWRGRRAWGEVHDENACGLGGIAGHAGLFGTGRDVAALGLAWLNEDERLGIAPEMMRRARQEQAVTGEMRRGLGWHLKARVGASAGDLMSADTYGHTGFTGCTLWIDPARRLVVVTLTNAVYYGRGFAGVYDWRRALHDAVVRATDSL